MAKGKQFAQLLTLATEDGAGSKPQPPSSA